jgi:hypothetical protein
VQAWVRELEAKYAADNDKMIGTIKGGVFSIGKFEEKDGVFTRIHGTKRDVPIVCGTGSNNSKLVEKLGLYADKLNVGIGKIPSKAAWSRCDIMELLSREETNMAWYTPEEMSVLTTTKAAKAAKNEK